MSSSSTTSGTSINDPEIPLLLSLLHQYLPYSLPLFCRLQFHLLHPNPPHASAFVAVASQTSVDTLSWLQTSSFRNNPWLAAHIDLSNSGQTNVWLFASWEPNHSDLTYSTDKGPQAETPPLSVQQALFQSLYTTLKTTHIPLLPSTPPTEWQFLKATGKYAFDYSCTRVLFGTLHSTLIPLLPQSHITRIDPGYLKYIFHYPSTISPPNPIPLPEGYKFAPLQRQHLQLVLSRTSIPRTIKTLSSLVSVGLFHSDSADPIGWGFLGKDASLSSLHTEPQHRGKNLAVLVSKELFRMQASTFSAGGDRLGGGVLWCHADVSDHNTGSRRVMEKLGGVVGWRDAWVEVDLETIETLS